MTTKIIIDIKIGKKDDKYLAPPEIFFASPGCVQLATALRRQTVVNSASY